MSSKLRAGALIAALLVVTGACTASPSGGARPVTVERTVANYSDFHLEEFAPRESGTCDGARLAEGLVRFTLAYSSGRIAQADRSVTSAPEFRWFSDASVRPDRVAESSSNRASLLEWFKARAAARDTIVLEDVAIRGRRGIPNVCDFQWIGQRYASDIDTTMHFTSGKGAMSRSGQIIVWSFGGMTNVREQSLCRQPHTEPVTAVCVRVDAQT